MKGLETIPRWLVAPLLLAGLALVLAAARPYAARPTDFPPSGPEAHGGIPGDLDVYLYRDIVTRVAAGEDYWSAAMAEHRRHGFPTVPSITVREPAMTWLLAALRTPIAARIAQGALVVLASILTWLALRKAATSPVERVAACVLQLVGFACDLSPRAIYIHEMWACALIVLALATWRLGWLWPALLAGVAAALIRELALPFLVAMGFCAGIEKRWREAAAWALATALCVALLAAHLFTVSHLQAPTDGASPGWTYVGGWRFAIRTAKWSYLIGMLPDWGNTALVLLSLLGFAAVSDGLAFRALVICGGYLAAFMVIGRPENLYWGYLFAGLLPLGSAFAPRALVLLGRRLMIAVPTSRQA